MCLFVDVPETLNAVVCVDLGSSQAAVPEQLFYGIELCPIPGKVGSKTMPEYMRTFLFCCSYKGKVFFYGIVDLSGIERQTLFAQKKVWMRLF